MTLELAIILPTLNERENLRGLERRLSAALEGIEWEAIIVDDNSQDGTADEARALSLENPRIRCIQRICLRSCHALRYDHALFRIDELRII